MNAPSFPPRPGTFHTGKVEIGRAYIRPPQRVEGHAVKVQEALLERRTLEPQSLLRRLVGRVLAWL